MNKNFRTVNSTLLGLESQKKCKGCGKFIPLWQYDHYLKTFEIELSFCRNYIMRLECFPANDKLGKKDR